jgi:hypothetical protein
VAIQVGGQATTVNLERRIPAGWLPRSS